MEQSYKSSVNSTQQSGVESIDEIKVDDVYTDQEVYRKEYIKKVYEDIYPPQVDLKELELKHVSEHLVYLGIGIVCAIPAVFCLLSPLIAFGMLLFMKPDIPVNIGLVSSMGLACFLLFFVALLNGMEEYKKSKLRKKNLMVNECTDLTTMK